MIIIFTDNNDPSSKKVFEWLDKLEVPYVIIYPESKFEISSIIISNENEDFNMIIENKIISFSEISGIWYRRGWLPLFEIKNPNPSEKFHNEEIKRIKEYILSRLDLKPHINRMHSGTVNKLEMLSCAKKCGLTIPQTLIINSTSAEKNIIKQDDFFLKSISETTVSYNEDSYFVRYKMVEKVDISKNFGLTQFQKYEEKEFEIRVFHFFGKNYGMAMFTQSNEETKLDFRVYGLEKKNRCVPITIPYEVNQSINRMMKISGNNSGSIDMIYRKGQFIFIELNPIGQYDMVSVPCNYNLDKVIALKLKSFYEKEKR